MVVHRVLEGHMIEEVEAGTKAVGIDHKPGQDLEVEELVADNLQLEGLQLEKEVGKAADLDLRVGKAVVVVAHMDWVAELEEGRDHRELPRH
ncbi:hypothetical protein VP1G_10574 [Cytospora mali]|uniref:Uncharacterized protein n=1 Tax=Cytospora mali TaxID=578113 RepID=A0A194UQ95_CYTMA|nr:hypothetical protein VP1G_10574 [Valsa mali var. pyri (nom. inval.)]